MNSQRISITFLLILLLIPLMTWAKDDNKQVLFALTECSAKQNEIIQGDSAIISVWLYSSFPFDGIKCTSGEKSPKIGGCNVRQITQYSGGRQTRRYIDGVPRYCTLWARYVVSSEKKATFTWPAQEFSAIIYVEQQQGIDPFDPFGFFSNPTYKKAKVETKSEPLKFHFIAEPTKSTEELMKSGHTII